MNMINLIIELFSDYTIRTIAIGTSILGITSGALGAFAVLRKQSLLGDAISHATLPGIVIAFLLTRTKSPLFILIGAMIAGWLGTLLVLGIIRNTRIKSESALGLILSVFFGFGIVLLTIVQKMPDANQAGLDKFLFGQAAALLKKDIIMMAILGGISLLTLIIFWKEFKLLTFDSGYASSLGLPIHKLDILLTSIIVVAIVIGLKSVGVILMSALIVAPGASARQWTDKLYVMVILSGFFGALSGVTGAVISSSASNLPTGPVIVLCLTAIVLISLFFAPNRGLVWNFVKKQASRTNIHAETVLLKLYQLAEQHNDYSHTHNISVIYSMVNRNINVRACLNSLRQKELVAYKKTDNWSLTKQGYEKAKKSLNTREAS